MRYALLACLLPAFSAATRQTDRLYGPQFEDRFGPCPLSVAPCSGPIHILDAGAYYAARVEEAQTIAAPKGW